MITAILMFVRIVKEQHSGVNGTKTPWFTIVQDNPLQEPIEYKSSPIIEPDNDLTTSTTLSSSPESDSLVSSPNPTKAEESSLGSGMRRNHSDLVLQSLLSEEEFADVFNISPKLGPLREEDETMGISPGRSGRANNNMNNLSLNTNAITTTDFTTEPSITRKSSIRLPMKNNAPTETKPKSTSALRTSNPRDKDSLAMNLALHNLNQMSLKIQQMQLGK